MGANYVKLETITVGEAGASSVTFNNIPQSGYTDLKVVVSCRSNRAALADGIVLTFSPSAGSVYSYKYLEGNGASAASGGASSQANLQGFSIPSATATANTFSNTEIYIPNYTVSQYKSISSDSVMENNATTSYTDFLAGLWSSNSAITGITLAPVVGTAWVQYSTFSLYGLAAVGTTPVIAPYASGGDIIQTDGTYWYHAFLSSGTFTPAKGLSCDVLVVAGGGSGGAYAAGGGGAGGALAFTSQALTANTAKTVTVGAGAAGCVISGNNNGNNGSNSQFGSLTAAIGGGAGAGGANETDGFAGGCGGGASGADQPIARAGGTGSQGYNGGSASSSSYGSPYSACGGGGMGGAGLDRSGSYAGAGGAGINTISGWGSLSAALTTTGLGVGGYIAGGGGGNALASGYGGAAGSGGASAGIGNETASSQNATPNTGSGSGGAYSASSGKGGSGLVIVRYAV